MQRIKADLIRVDPFPHFKLKKENLFLILISLIITIFAIVELKRVITVRNVGLSLRMLLSLLMKPWKRTSALAKLNGSSQVVEAYTLG